MIAENEIESGEILKMAKTAKTSLSSLSAGSKVRFAKVPQNLISASRALSCSVPNLQAFHSAVFL
jgi:hypothetical protein